MDSVDFADYMERIVEKNKVEQASAFIPIKLHTKKLKRSPGIFFFRVKKVLIEHVFSPISVRLRASF